MATKNTTKHYFRPMAARLGDLESEPELPTLTHEDKSELHGSGIPILMEMASDDPQVAEDAVLRFAQSYMDE